MPFAAGLPRQTEPGRAKTSGGCYGVAMGVLSEVWLVGPAEESIAWCVFRNEENICV
jgi:hypothetical protein